MGRGSLRINAKLQHLLLVIPSATRQCESVSLVCILSFPLSSLIPNTKYLLPSFKWNKFYQATQWTLALSSMDDGSALISLWLPKASTLLITPSFSIYSFLLDCGPLFSLPPPHRDLWSSDSYTSTLSVGSLRGLALCLLFPSLYVPGFSKRVLLKVR